MGFGVLQIDFAANSVRIGKKGKIVKTVHRTVCEMLDRCSVFLFFSF